ncbi:hypothetical protein OKA04_14860 [Luteolibacter flavescens]|uniref:DUF6799 domain-containing protein n=1 Tax=Luteolibacter flavescens TaxID=1859460 RepID=A0ABT3FR05_9BACT|nr:DUF6799 domain-containing protein [Luteolibacter flavescens]MCW1886016.1 hypothetical protein [Luteolibacter flavescens]
MKTHLNSPRVLIAILAATIGFAAAKDGIAMKDGKVVTVKDGNKTDLTEEATLKDGTKVGKDGSVVSPNGTQWSLKNGEFLDWDGKFSVYFIADGVVRKDGKVWLVKAGEKSEVSTETTLTDGTKIMADGNVISKEGKKWEIDDGDAVFSDGRPVLEGSVVGWGEKPLIAEDCGGTVLEEEKSFPNGNKVQADGTILFSDGTKGKLGDLDVIQEDGTYLPAKK